MVMDGMVLEVELVVSLADGTDCTSIPSSEVTVSISTRSSAEVVLLCCFGGCGRLR